MRPLETRYKGYLFRSRREARWAVYFDSSGIRWEYESQGFDLGGELGWYLPDFWLPDSWVFIEIKAADIVDDADAVSTAIVKCNLLSNTGRQCLLVIGSPGKDSYHIHFYVDDDVG